MVLAAAGPPAGSGWWPPARGTEGPSASGRLVAGKLRPPEDAAVAVGARVEGAQA